MTGLQKPSGQGWEELEAMAPPASAPKSREHITQEIPAVREAVALPAARRAPRLLLGVLAAIGVVVAVMTARHVSSPHAGAPAAPTVVAFRPASPALAPAPAPAPLRRLADTPTPEKPALPIQTPPHSKPLGFPEMPPNENPEALAPPSPTGAGMATPPATPAAPAPVAPVAPKPAVNYADQDAQEAAFFDSLKHKDSP